VEVQKLIAARLHYDVLGREANAELPLTSESADGSVTLTRQELKSFSINLWEEAACVEAGTENMCSRKSVGVTNSESSGVTEAKHTSFLLCLLNGDSVLYGELDELSTRS
jgi:hypothetical protein